METAWSVLLPVLIVITVTSSFSIKIKHQNEPRHKPFEQELMNDRAVIGNSVDTILKDVSGNILTNKRHVSWLKKGIISAVKKQGMIRNSMGIVFKDGAESLRAHDELFQLHEKGFISALKDQGMIGNSIIEIGNTQDVVFKDGTESLRDSEDHFDWREKGVISPVKNQGMSVAVVGIVLTEGVESLHAIQTQTNVTLLSVEETDACCTTYGQPKYKGFSCFPIIGGLCTPETYKRGSGECNNNTCPSVASVKDTVYIPPVREDLMKSHIHTSPLVAYIDAGHTSFMTYTSGIYKGPDCSKSQVDHVVQIVGYGTEEGIDYWIIKNSWGRNWGEEGYMRILRGENTCGIAGYVFYPV